MRYYKHHKINEDINDVFDSSLIDYSEDFEKSDEAHEAYCKYYINMFNDYLPNAPWDWVSVELRYNDDAPCSWDSDEYEKLYEEDPDEFYEMKDKFESWANDWLNGDDAFDMVFNDFINTNNLEKHKEKIKNLCKSEYKKYISSKEFDEDFVPDRFGPDM